MTRRTITLPEALAEAVDALVAQGAVASVSRFFQEAGRRHLAALAAARLAEEAAKLDPDEEEALARGTPRTPWGRLR